MFEVLFHPHNKLLKHCFFFVIGVYCTHSKKNMKLDGFGLMNSFFFFSLLFFCCTRSLLLCAGFSLVAVHGLLLAVASRCRAQVFRHSGFSSSGT